MSETNLLEDCFKVSRSRVIRVKTQFRLFFGAVKHDTTHRLSLDVREEASPASLDEKKIRMNQSGEATVMTPPSCDESARCQGHTNQIKASLSTSSQRNQIGGRLEMTCLHFLHVLTSAVRF